MLAFAQWLESTSLSVAIQATGWVIPLLQSIHIVMIGIVFIAILMAALTILGQVHTDESLSDVWRRYSPWMWSGLAVMVVTGGLLVIGEPVRQFTALSFWLKMILLGVGVASAVAFGRSMIPAAMAAAERGSGFSSGAKASAVATVVLWLAIIFLGRAIAYDLEVWGRLSLSS